MEVNICSVLHVNGTVCPVIAMRAYRESSHIALLSLSLGMEVSEWSISHLSYFNLGEITSCTL